MTWVEQKFGWKPVANPVRLVPARGFTPVSQFHEISLEFHEIALKFHEIAP